MSGTTHNASTQRIDDMTLTNFQSIVNRMLASKTGMVLDDLPDIDFYQFFDEDFDEEEINDAAKECVSTILYDNEMTELD